MRSKKITNLIMLTIAILLGIATWLSFAQHGSRPDKHLDATTTRYQLLVFMDSIMNLEEQL